MYILTIKVATEADVDTMLEVLEEADEECKFDEPFSVHKSEEVA